MLWTLSGNCIGVLICRTLIVGKGGLLLTSIIFKYKTSTTYLLYGTMQCFVLINK